MNCSTAPEQPSYMFEEVEQVGKEAVPKAELLLMPQPGAFPRPGAAVTAACPFVLAPVGSWARLLSITAMGAEA